MVTGKRTFQKFFTQEELRQWIERVVLRPPVAAAPGIFYVFRDKVDEQSFAVNRVSRHRKLVGVEESQELIADHRRLLEPLVAFVNRHGRIPVDGELSTTPQLVQVFGSVARACSLLRRRMGTDQWDRIREQRRDDALVYLALATFSKRPRFSDLPDELRYDIRAFFGSYKSSCAEADALLFSAGDQDVIDHACRRATVGKLLPDALYVHHTAVHHLPPVLRVYEGCGRQLAGSVDQLTLVKLFRQRACISYLAYEDFDRVAHPSLQTSIVADLKRLDLHFHDYRTSGNPPILHRKELFVAHDYRNRAQFAALTHLERQLGLLNNTNAIGTIAGWLAVLADHGVTLQGHKIIPNPPR